MLIDTYEMETSFDRAVKLLRALIDLHPAYGTAGQESAALLIARVMREGGWDDVREFSYLSGQLEDKDGFVSVKHLGSTYEADDTLKKINVVGVVDSGRSGPDLIVNGHYDVEMITAPHQWRRPEFWRSAHIEDGRLYGRGSTDMLGGLCTSLEVVSMFARHRARWRGRIVFMAVTDEEIGGNGTVACLSSMLDAGIILSAPRIRTECLIAEPTEGRLCTESLGFTQCTIDVAGSPVHMGTTAGEDAYSAGNRALSDFKTAFNMVARSLCPDRTTERFVYNFGRVEAGEDPSVKPAHFKAEGVMFFPGGLKRREVLESLSGTYSKLTKTNAKLSYGGFVMDGATFVGGELYRLGSDLIGRYINGRDRLFRSPCDARLFQALGIETVICGPGNLEQAHSTDEFISLTDLRAYFDDFLNLAYWYVRP